MKTFKQFISEATPLSQAFLRITGKNSIPSEKPIRLTTINRLARGSKSSADFCIKSDSKIEPLNSPSNTYQGRAESGRNTKGSAENPDWIGTSGNRLIDYFRALRGRLPAPMPGTTPSLNPYLPKK